MRTPKARAGQAEPDADQGARLGELYQEHYRPLVRLAALLVSDLATAEEIAQEAFAEAHGTWPALPGHDAALRCLRQSVIQHARSVSALQAAASLRVSGLPAAGPDAGLLTALRALPVRQREVLVLRYFADLPESEIAAVTGTRIAVIKSYTAQGMSTLRAGLPGNVALGPA
jgi:DNA-directed RNA polymerase specialized sigma24 family protein